MKYVLFILISLSSFAQKVDSTSGMKAIPVKLDTLSYAAEYKQDAFQFNWGVRLGGGLGELATRNGTVVRVSSNGTPLLQNGRVVRDELVSNTGRVPVFQGALFLRFTRGSFYLQPEVVFSQKGGKFDFLDAQDNLVNRVTGTFTTIDVPLALGMRIGNARIFTGPVFSYALQMDQELQGSLKPYTIEPLSSSFFQKPILLGMAGFGLQFNKIFMDLRYESGFGRYIDRSIGPGSNSSSFFLSSNQLNLSLGYLF